MVERIKVVVVDDSAVVRKFVSETLAQDPDLEVVGLASNGRNALQQIDLLKPDVITLDIKMPEMDGLEALWHIRSKDKELPVIMFSSYTQEGATATMQALELGANDFLAKPSAQDTSDSTKEQVKSELIQRVKALGMTRRKKTRAKFTVPATEVRQGTHPPSVIGIAISTGGPNALVEMVGGLAPSLQTPILITQHMPPYFTKLLAERLRMRGPLPAYEAEHGQVIEPGTIYIAPGDYHLEVARDAEQVILQLSQAPAENSCRPSADVMFRSLVSVFGSGVLGVVMTGMGNDGQRGCECIKQYGGVVLAQDEATSTVWGMPKAVVTTKLADDVIPLPDIATSINKRCHAKTKV